MRVASVQKEVNIRALLTFGLITGYLKGLWTPSSWKMYLHVLFVIFPVMSELLQFEIRVVLGHRKSQSV